MTRQMGLFDKPESFIYKASYNKNLPEKFQDNPLIEALPPLKSDTDLYSALFEPIKEPDLDAPPEVRAALMVDAVKNQFILFPGHFDLAKKIDLMLRSGYVDRDPSTKCRNKLLQSLYEQQQSGGASCSFTSNPKSASSFSILGLPGSGKTIGVERILGLNPQAVRHPVSNLIQIVYLKVECPHNSSLRTLCINFLREIDNVLGTTEADEIGYKEGESSLLEKMKNKVALYSIGILIIDEFQNLNSRKSNSSELFRFIVYLVNNLSLPVIFMGTPEASVILNSGMASARRTIGYGAVTWNPLALDYKNVQKLTDETQEYWTTFTEALWDNNWLVGQNPLTEELKDKWFELSQGVLDIAVKLYIGCQLKAISSGKEVITLALMEYVYKHEFTPVHNLLNTLQDNQASQMSNYPDLDTSSQNKHHFALPEDTYPLKLSSNLDSKKVEKLANIIIKARGITKSKAFEISESLCLEDRNASLEELAQIALKRLEKAKRKKFKKGSNIEDLASKEVHESLSKGVQSMFKFNNDKSAPT
jgi:hypothetical protein